MKRIMFFVLFMFSSLSSLQAEVIIILGAPGAGKGVQSRLLSEAKGIPHISTGDLFRENRRNDTPLGQKIRAFMDAGELVADKLVFDILFDRITQKDCENGYILDGFPRTLAQAESLVARIGEKEILRAFSLELADEVIMERIAKRQISQQRADDIGDVVRNRLAIFHKESAPIKNFFNERNSLHSIDGSKDIEEVFEALMEVS